MLMRWQLKWDEALREIEKAVELDPLSPIIHANFGYYYFARGDYARAIELFKQAAELGMADHWSLAVAYGRMKMFEEMKREFAASDEQYKTQFPLARMDSEAATAYLLNDRQTLRRLLPELENHFQETGTNRVEIARYHFAVGEIDKGFEWLERSYSEKETFVLGIASTRELDGVRNDPRYLDLLKRLGLD
jgi:tetratricopeptide (TPR) repeat protein